jgi:hypothetical protein
MTAAIAVTLSVPRTRQWSEALQIGQVADQHDSVRFKPSMSLQCPPRVGDSNFKIGWTAAPIQKHLGG